MLLLFLLRLWKSHFKLLLSFLSLQFHIMNVPYVCNGSIGFVVFMSLTGAYINRSRLQLAHRLDGLGLLIECICYVVCAYNDFRGVFCSKIHQLIYDEKNLIKSARRAIVHQRIRKHAHTQNETKTHRDSAKERQPLF